jgi:hypothetical protein
MKVKVEVIGLDELMDKLKELHNLLQEINSEALAIATACNDKIDIDKLAKQLADRLKDAKATLS